MNPPKFRRGSLKICSMRMQHITTGEELVIHLCKEKMKPEDLDRVAKFAGNENVSGTTEKRNNVSAERTLVTAPPPPEPASIPPPTNMFDSDAFSGFGIRFDIGTSSSWIDDSIFPSW